MLVARWAVVCFVLAGACALGPRRLDPLGPPGAPRSMRVMLAPGPGWPYRVEKVVVAVDGMLVYQSFAPGQRPPPRRLAAIDGVAPGIHTVTAELQWSAPCALFGGERELLQVRASSSFDVGTEPAVVEIRPRLGGAEAPLRLGIFLRGGIQEDDLAAGWPLPPRFDDAACDPLAQPDRAVCQVGLRIEAARQARDIIWLTCLNDKQIQLHVLQRNLADAGETAHGVALRPVAERRAEELAREAEECVGYDIAFLGPPDELRVLRACDGPDPFGEDGR